MKKYFKITGILIMIIWGVFIAINKHESNKKRKLEANFLRSEFPNIENYGIYRDSTIAGIVIRKKLDLGQFNKGALYLSLNNGSKLSIGSATTNYLYDTPQMIDFIQINDSISKPAGDNLVLIYRGNEKFFFKLGEIINSK